MKWSGLLYKQFKLNGSHKKPTRASHHRVTTSTDDAAILNAVREWPETTSNSLIGELNLVASARTVRRRLRDAGLNRKDTLLPWHVEERYEFANSYLDKQHTPDFWSKVIFVDERTFTTYNSKYVQIINHKQSGILGYRKFLYWQLLEFWTMELRLSIRIFSSKLINFLKIIYIKI